MDYVMADINEREELAERLYQAWRLHNATKPIWAWLYEPIKQAWRECAAAALAETAALRERLARAEATLADGLSLVEITDAASEVGSDTWAWCYAARSVLATPAPGAADDAT